MCTRISSLSAAQRAAATAPFIPPPVNTTTVDTASALGPFARRLGLLTFYTAGSWLGAFIGIDVVLRATNLLGVHPGKFTRWPNSRLGQSISSLATLATLPSDGYRAATAVSVFVWRFTDRRKCVGAGKSARAEARGSLHKN